MRRFMPVDTAIAALGGERTFRSCAAHTSSRRLLLHKSRLSGISVDPLPSMGYKARKI
jgi:hypothetical protein